MNATKRSKTTKKKPKEDAGSAELGRKLLNEYNLGVEIVVTAIWGLTVFSDAITFIPSHMSHFGSLTSQQIQVVMLLATFVPMFALVLAQKTFEEYELFYKAYSGIILIMIFLALVPIDYGDFTLSATVLIEVVFLSVMGLLWGQILLFKFMSIDRSIIARMRLITIVRLLVMAVVIGISQVIFMPNTETTDVTGYVFWFASFLFISLFKTPESWTGKREKQVDGKGTGE
jgi:hypothetical protein